MGTPDFSVPTLELLQKTPGIKIECVYTQPPRKKNRGQKLVKSPIAIVAEKFKISVRDPNNLDTSSEFAYLKKLSPKFVIVVAYGKIIPEKFLNLPNVLFINLHASLLPKWRGAAPIQRAIMNEDKEAGLSIMKILPKLDEGPYMQQVKFSIDQYTTTQILSKKLSIIGAETIIKSLKILNKGEENFIEQDHSKASYAKKISKSESKINWREQSSKIIAKINALNPSPGAWFQNGTNRIKIWKAQIENTRGKVGEVLDDYLTISCVDGAIKILELQKEGKKKMSTKEFLTGNKISKGDILN